MGFQSGNRHLRYHLPLPALLAGSASRTRDSARAPHRTRTGLPGAAARQPGLPPAFRGAEREPARRLVLVDGGHRAASRGCGLRPPSVEWSVDPAPPAVLLRRAGGRGGGRPLQPQDGDGAQRLSRARCWCSGLLAAPIDARPGVLRLRADGAAGGRSGVLRAGSWGGAAAAGRAALPLGGERAGGDHLVGRVRAGRRAGRRGDRSARLARSAGDRRDDLRRLGAAGLRGSSLPARERRSGQRGLADADRHQGFPRRDPFHRHAPRGGQL